MSLGLRGTPACVVPVFGRESFARVSAWLQLMGESVAEAGAEKCVQKSWLRQRSFVQGVRHRQTTWVLGCCGMGVWVRSSARGHGSERFSENLLAQEKCCATVAGLPRRGGRVVKGSRL